RLRKYHGAWGSLVNRVSVAVIYSLLTPIDEDGIRADNGAKLPNQRSHSGVGRSFRGRHSLDLLDEPAAEPERQFGGCGLRGIGAMDEVCLDVVGEVPAYGAGSGFFRLESAHHL